MSYQDSSLIESGYHGATMADIASRSGLAVQTVSYFFGTKSKLLSQLIQSTINQAIGGAPPPEQLAWERDAAQSRSPVVLIDSFVDVGHDILMAAAPLMDVARIGGLTDVEVASVYHFHEQWRRRDYARFVGWLDELGALRPTLDPATATDIVLTAFGPETYLALSHGRGWASEQIREGMRESLRLLLLPPDALSAPRANPSPRPTC